MPFTKRGCGPTCLLVSVLVLFHLYNGVCHPSSFMEFEGPCEILLISEFDSTATSWDYSIVYYFSTVISIFIGSIFNKGLIRKLISRTTH